MKISKINITGLSALLLLLGIYSATAQELTIKGRFNSKDSLRVVLGDMKKNDTLWTTNGTFSFRKPACGTLLHLFFYEPKTKKRFERKFFAASGEVNLGSDTVVTLSDPHLQQLYAAFNWQNDSLVRLKTGLRILPFADNKPNVEERALVAKSYQAITDLQLAEAKRFVIDNKSNLVGAYILTAYLYGSPDIRQTDSLARLFDPAIAAVSYPLQKLKAYLAVKMSLRPGQVLPVLAAGDLNGKPFNSASLKGRYVVLDFWGTWCNPCVSGLPKMKAAYEKYKSRVSFVSIACHDKESKWRAMIARQNMTWTQILDNEHDDIARQYYVEQFPTKILVGPDGKIIQAFNGEGEAFYQKLDELMSGK